MFKNCLNSIHPLAIMSCQFKYYVTLTTINQKCSLNFFAVLRMGSL